MKHPGVGPLVPSTRRQATSRLRTHPHEREGLEANDQNGTTSGCPLRRNITITEGPCTSNNGTTLKCGGRRVFAQTTRRRRFARSSSPCFIGSFLIHDVVRRDCHSGIAPRGFVSMRDRQHRIARPRPATIMTYRSACGCRSNRAHSSLKKDRLPKARSVRDEAWSRALGSGALASPGAIPCGRAIAPKWL